MGSMDYYDKSLHHRLYQPDYLYDLIIKQVKQMDLAGIQRFLKSPDIDPSSHFIT